MGRNKALGKSAWQTGIFGTLCIEHKGFGVQFVASSAFARWKLGVSTDFFCRVTLNVDAGKSM
jgi:hypothetical protein